MTRLRVSEEEDLPFDDEKMWREMIDILNNKNLSNTILNSLRFKIFPEKKVAIDLPLTEEQFERFKRLKITAKLLTNNSYLREYHNCSKCSRAKTIGPNKKCGKCSMIDYTTLSNLFENKIKCKFFEKIKQEVKNDQPTL